MSALTDGRAVPAPREPAIVQSLFFLLDPVAYAGRLHARFGPVFQLTLTGTGPLVFVTRPDLVKRVLTERTTFENYSGDEILAPLIGPTGLILLTGTTHLRRRKLLLPPFHGDRLARWTQVVTDIAHRELAAVPRDRPVAIRPVMQTITVEVICRVVFGVDDPDHLHRLTDAIERWSSPRFALPLMFPALRKDLGPRSPWSGLQRARAEMRALLDEAITTARRHPDPASRDDVLSTLIGAIDEDGQPGYTHDELHDELLGLLFAGQDTTASALAWACLMLAEHPDAWQHLVDEATNNTGGEWADAIGQETLRLRPSVAAAGRYALHDTDLDGITIPSGTRLGTLTLSGIDAGSYPDPRAFCPERWLTDEQPSNYASTPFGGGVHRCIGAALAGLEIRTVLHELARTTTGLQPAPGRPDRHISYSAVLIPSRGARIILDPAPTPTTTTTGRVPSTASELTHANAGST